MRRELTPGELAAAAWASIRARRLVAALIVVACVAGALTYSAVGRRQEARIEVALNPANAVQAVFNEPRRFTPGPSGADFRQDAVLRPVSKRTGIPVDELRDRTTVVQGGDERRAVLAVRAETGAEAARVAEVWVEEVIADRRRALRRQIEDAAREVRARARRLRRETTVITRRDVLRALLAIEAVTVTPPEVRQVDPPQVRGTTLSPPLSAGAGLALAGLLLLVLAALDGRLRTAPVASVVGGTVAVRAQRRDGTLDGLTPALFERLGTSAPPTILVTALRPADAAAWGADVGAAVAAGDRSAAVITVGLFAGSGPVGPDGLAVLEERLRAAVAEARGGAPAHVDARSVTATPEQWHAFLLATRDLADVVVLASERLGTPAPAAALRLADAAHVAVAVEGRTRRSALREARVTAAAAGRELTLVVVADRPSLAG